MIDDKLSGRRVLITGVSGFLGLALCHQLRASGARVTGLDIRPPAIEGQLTPPHSFVQLDLADPLLVPFLTDYSFDTIFHLAGRTYAADSVSAPAQDFSQNLAASFHLLEAVRQSRFRGRFLFASSAAVYGEPQTLPIGEQTRTRPISPYGASKLATEAYIQVYAQQYGFKAGIARLFSLYGPRQHKQVVFDILRKTLCSDGPIALLGDGREVRDFIYVEDAVRALMALAEYAAVDGPIWNVCSGNGIAIRDLAHLVVTLAEQAVERITFSGQQRGGDPRQWIGDNRALLHTGYAPNFSLSAGLRETVAWFRCQQAGLTQTST